MMREYLDAIAGAASLVIIFMGLMYAPLIIGG